MRTLQMFSELSVKELFFFCSTFSNAALSVCSAACAHLPVGPWGLLPASPGTQQPLDLLSPAVH